MDIKNEIKERIMELDPCIQLDEEYESYYSNALEWYEYNDLGYGSSMEGTPAFACSDEFEIIH
jgi:hypothetical protein